VSARIQRRRTKGWRMSEGAIYVGRPSRWGNPWVATVLGPEFAVSRFRGWLSGMAVIHPAEYAKLIEPLRGHDLVCWCPEACGEDVTIFDTAYGSLYEPCAKPKGHDGGHDPSVALWCHADVLLELAR
jgi:Domain of unknown function (DUF4326)